LAGLRRVELLTVLGVPNQPQELCKRLTRHCPNHRFPLSSRVRLSGCQLEHTRSPEYSHNTLPRTGVPGNGNNLSHGTSPQVPRTRRTTRVPRYSKAKTEAAEAQPASGLRRRHRPCRLQEGDIGGVALPVRWRHRVCRLQANRGFWRLFFLEPPRNGRNTTHGGGEHAYHARKPLNTQTTLEHPKNMDSTLGGKPHSHEHGVLTLPKPQSHENHGLDGEGIMLRAKESDVPTSTRRTHPLGPSRWFGRLLLTPHGTNTTTARTERHPPQHGRLNTGEAPQNRWKLREGERKRGKGEARERGKGLGRPGFKPAVLRRRHTPCRHGNQKATHPPSQPTDNGQISEFEKVKATAILSRSPDTTRAVLVIRVVSESLHEKCHRVPHDHVFCSGKATSVDTACASVDLLSQNSPDGVLGKPLVSTLPVPVSTYCPKTVQKVVMKNPWSQMGPGKSDEHPS
ncbi:hypothetical protein Taro_019533, partial [Colocasia esculenta]|nr:hypothetical protein [Colocasia esculenta]